MLATMKHASHRRQKAEKGSTVIETALCLLLFLTVIFAIIEFGLFLYSYNVLAAATREASRYAMVHGSRSGSVATASDVRAQVIRWGIGLNPAALVVNTTWTPGNTPGSRVRVESSYTLNPITALIVNTPIRIRSRSEMVISQ
jgi:Flp pilus assembly protein TadG